MQHPRIAASWLVLLLLCAARLVAQCDPVWGSANLRPDLGGTGRCSTTWDPDGAGPEVLRLVVGGSNLVTGASTQTAKVATFDGTRWTTLGTGPGTAGEVWALTVWNGQLIAAGTFTGGGVDRVAAWNGTSWLPVGSGAPTSVTALTVWNNLLVAAGYSTPGSTPSIRTWNGNTWNTLPNPPNLQRPTAAVSFQGLLCVGGDQLTAAAPGVLERWNGSAWASSFLCYSTTSFTGQITCLAVRPSIAVGGTDTLYVGGYFTQIGTTLATSLASTTNITSPSWSPVAANTTSECIALQARTVGLSGLTVTAAFAGTTHGVRQFSSSTGTWSTLGSLPAGPSSLVFYGGSYHGTHAAQSTACVRWNGSGWGATVGLSLAGEVRALTSRGDDIVVGGAFTSATSTPLNRIARWNGTTFEALDTGITGTSVDALTTRSNGDVVAGGSFTMAGSTIAANIARWTGAVWVAIGTGTNDQVFAVKELPNGDLIAGGKFTTAGGVPCNRIARWNGTAWSSLNFGFNADVLALAVKDDGTLFAAGSFTAAGTSSCSRIARWTGATWQPLGSGMNGDVHALAFRPNGDLVAVGAFTLAGGVAVDRCAVWNGTAWAATGSSSGDATPARSVCVLPNGDVVAGRGFHQPGVAIDAGIARWNGTTWSGFTTGLAASAANTPVTVRAIVQRRDGTLVVGGDFAFADGLVARGLATLTSGCPASAVSYGTGCSSGSGPLVLAADTLPWIGSTLRTTTTGIPPLSLAIAALGFAQIAVPLPSLLPQGQTGCSLLAAPDILLVQANGSAGTSTSSFAFPNDPAIVGLPLFQQTVPLEFDASFAIVAVRSSNALALVVGIF